MKKYLITDFLLKFQFDKKKLTSVEKEVRQGGADGDENDNPEVGLKESEAMDLTTW